MEIRRIKDDECDDLGRLTVRAYKELFPGGDLGDYEAMLRDVATRHLDSEVYVALGDAEELLGGVTFVPDATRAMSEFNDPEAAGIRMLAIDPMHQGVGAGKALTEYCVARGRELGRRRIILHSTSMMATARAMYVRMGFVAAPELDIWFDDDNGEPFHLIAYVFELR